MGVLFEGRKGDAETYQMRREQIRGLSGVERAKGMKSS